jgi:hypothetical protein
MPISTTLRRLDGGIYINADGLRTDADGIPLSSGSSEITVAPGDPEGVISANPGVFRYDATAKALYIKETGVGNTGWVRLI